MIVDVEKMFIYVELHNSEIIVIIYAALSDCYLFVLESACKTCSVL